MYNKIKKYYINVQHKIKVTKGDYNKNNRLKSFVKDKNSNIPRRSPTRNKRHKPPR